MLSKAIIKLIRSLDQKKYRIENNLFVAEGHKIVGEIIKTEIKINYIIAVKDWLNENKKLPKTEIFEVTEKELQQISFLKTPQQVLAVCYIPENRLNLDNLKNSLTLALDDIQDPGNLGTIIRIADWFGISTIICSEHTVDAYNPKVVQATMGSIARVNLHYTDLAVFFKSLPSEIPIYGTLLNGKNIYSQTLSKNGLIVIGNESKGISDELLPYISQKLYIPSYAENPGNKAESLNASVATAIVCAEFMRRTL